MSKLPKAAANCGAAACPIAAQLKASTQRFCLIINPAFQQNESLSSISRLFPTHGKVLPKTALTSLLHAYMLQQQLF
jgi:hypothetical protein